MFWIKMVCRGKNSMWSDRIVVLSSFHFDLFTLFLTVMHAQHPLKLRLSFCEFLMFFFFLLFFLVLFSN